MASLKAYYQLAKPGIVYGNAIAAMGGFFLASAGHPSWRLLVPMLIGLSLVIASACAFNNYHDRAADAKMARTKGRALVSGAVSKAGALAYAAFLAVAGEFILFLCVNPLCAALALFGLFAYAVVYTFSKPHTVYATHIGSVSGAVPPVAGYAAALGRLDLAALVLFLMLFAWQMPHFFAIALRRGEEYEAAGTPVLPSKRSFFEVKAQIIGYIAAFWVLSVLLAFLGYTGVLYFGLMAALGLGWLVIACLPAAQAKGPARAAQKNWAKRVFLVSLIVLLGASIALSVDAYRPMSTTLAFPSTM